MEDKKQLYDENDSVFQRFDKYQNSLIGNNCEYFYDDSRNELSIKYITVIGVFYTGDLKTLSSFGLRLCGFYGTGFNECSVGFKKIDK